MKNEGEVEGQQTKYSMNKHSVSDKNLNTISNKDQMTVNASKGDVSEELMKIHRGILDQQIFKSVRRLSLNFGFLGRHGRSIGFQGTII